MSVFKKEKYKCQQIAFSFCNFLFGALKGECLINVYILLVGKDMVADISTFGLRHRQ